MFACWIKHRHNIARCDDSDDGDDDDDDNDHDHDVLPEVHHVVDCKELARRATAFHLQT